MQFDRPLLFLDVEATGLNVAEDRVIQIGTVELQSGETLPENGKSILINPGRPIPDVITKLTGITDSSVASSPTFREFAANFGAYLKGFDLVGFNLMNFDIPMLAEEFLRVGVDPPFDQSQIVDCGVLFKRREERTLAAAVKFYCGKEPLDFHGALADALHTHDVFLGQIERYGLKNVGEAVTASRYPEDRRIDYAGKLSRDDQGSPIYTFGARTKGLRVRDDLGFAAWMLSRDFPLDTKRKLRGILEQIAAEEPMFSGSDLPF